MGVNRGQVQPAGAGSPASTPPTSRWLAVTVLVVAAAGGLVATTSPRAPVDWVSVAPPAAWLNADSVIATPTGFSILGGPVSAGGMVWSTVDGSRWVARTLPRVSSRIVAHRTGLFVIDGSRLYRIGADPDDPPVLIHLSEAVRIGSGSARPGLVAALDGLVAQTVNGDLWWSEDGRSFELSVPAGLWGADSDVTPPPPEVASVASQRVRSNCRPLARRAPDVLSITQVGYRIAALVPASEPSVVWPVCEPVMWASTDGLRWGRLSDDSPFPTGAHVHSFAWRQDRFVAVGGVGFDNPTAWTSRDGLLWIEIALEMPERDVDLTEVEAGEAGWVIVADPRDGSGRIAWFSPDGRCWDRLPAGTARAAVAVGAERIMFADHEGLTVGTPTDGPFRRCA